jgi:glycosyltransferase involved in cell wall biosynthesis
MQYPLVSAIVLCYNQAGFVEECLESVKAQDYPNLELIINDDASTDGSVAVIQDWLNRNNMPHQFIKNSRNQGICRSLNNVLTHARGKYVSGVAADDVWLPNKLITQVELMERLPETTGVLYSDALQMDESGKILPKRFIEAHRDFQAMPQGNIQKILWEANFIPAMTTLIKLECFAKAGLYDENLYFEDWDMWLRIARFYEFAYSGEVSAKYRLVSTSMVRSQFSKINDSMCQLCLKHLRQKYLKKECKKIVVLHLYNRAIYSFERATPGYRKWLLQALRFRPTIGLALRLLFSYCGLGPESFSRLRSAVPQPKFRAS